MATNKNNIIDDLLEAIDKADNGFNDVIPDIQKQAFAKVVKLSEQLELRSDGSIRLSVNNLRVISKIKQELDTVIYSKEYQKSLFNLTDSFNKIEDIQQKYFKDIETSFKPGTLFAELKKQSIDIISERLGKQALSTNISLGVRDILKTHIAGGSKYYDLVDSMRSYLTDTKTGEGALAKYAKTYTTDALNQYSATYDQLATDDLGLEWYEYYGSLKKTSRVFCKSLIEAKSEGMRFIHRSQFDDLLAGNINGKKIDINQKTDLPYGMIEGTTEASLQINRGGWGCGHLLKPVSSVLVPAELKKKFENS